MQDSCIGSSSYLSVPNGMPLKPLIRKIGGGRNSFTVSGIGSKRLQEIAAQANSAANDIGGTGDVGGARIAGGIATGGSATNPLMPTV